MSEDSTYSKKLARHRGRTANGIGSFLQRYSRMLAFFGATIVFSTFIVKEGWRESLKSLGDTIDTAQNVFTLRSDGLATTSQLNGLMSEVEAIRAKISGNEFGLTLPGVNRTMLLYSGELRQLHTSLDNLSSLMDRLPGQEQHKAELKKNKEQLQGEQLAFRHVGELAARATGNISAVSPDGSPSAEDAKAISSASFQLSTGISDLYRRVDNLTTATLADALVARTHQEQQYRVATWVSYSLYALGWGFGLIGKLFGIDSIDVPE